MLSRVEPIVINTSRNERQLNWRGVVLAIVLIALPIRLYLAVTAAMISRDGVEFIWYAQGLAREPVAEMKRQAQHPLYPAMVLAAHRVMEAVCGGSRPFPPTPATGGRRYWGMLSDPVLSWQAAAMAVTLIGGLAVVVAVHAVARALFDARVALIAALMAAAAAELCQLSADALTDMPHLAVYLFALAAGIRGITGRSWRWLFLCGALSGFAHLLRPEGAEAAVAIVTIALVHRSFRLRQRVTGVLAVVMGAALVASPYMLVTGKLVQKKSIGQFLPWMGAEDRYQGLTPLANHFCPSRATAAIGDTAGNDAAAILNVTKALGTIGEKYGRSLRVTFLIPAIAWWLLRRRSPSEAPAVSGIGGRVVAVAAGLHLVILLALIFRFDYWDMMSIRHVMILTGLTLPFAAAGVAAILDMVPQPRRRTAAILLTIGLVGPTLPWMLERRNADNLYLRRTGEWLRANSQGKPRVLTTRHAVSFYADGIDVRSPLEADVEAILAEARRLKPNYLVFDQRRMLRDKRDFFETLETSLLPGESLQKIHVEPQQQKRWLDRAIVYRYRPPS